MIIVDKMMSLVRRKKKRVREHIHVRGIIDD